LQYEYGSPILKFAFSDETNMIAGNTKGDENIQQPAGMEFHLTIKT